MIETTLLVMALANIALSVGLVLVAEGYCRASQQNGELRVLTERLKSSGDALGKAVADNTPPGTPASTTGIHSRGKKQ